MREIGRTVADWLKAGHRVAVARVVDVHGFGAVPAGEVLAVRDDGARAGELLRGVADPVISGVVPAALGGESSVVNAPVGESEAVAAGLACAGSARVLVHAVSDPAVWAALGEGSPVALATSLTSGESVAVGGPSAVAEEAARLLAAYPGGAAGAVAGIRGRGRRGEPDPRTGRARSGARSPAETAVSIVAEVLAVRAGRAGVGRWRACLLL